MAGDAGLGVSDDPGEVIWEGGAVPFDLNTELDNWISEIALDRILLAIIDAHSITDENGDSIDRRRERLEHAKAPLLGRPLPRGAPPLDDREAKVREIARRYWIAYATEQEGVTLSSIAADVVTPNWKQQNHDWKEVEALARSCVEAFKQQKDRLLLEVSAEGLPAIPESARRVDKIIALLGELGLCKR